MITFRWLVTFVIVALFTLVIGRACEKNGKPRKFWHFIAGLCILGMFVCMVVLTWTVRA